MTLIVQWEAKAALSRTNVVWLKNLIEFFLFLELKSPQYVEVKRQGYRCLGR